MLMQWMLPPPHRISLAGTEYTLTFSPYAAWIASRALHSISSAVSVDVMSIGYAAHPEAFALEEHLRDNGICGIYSELRSKSGARIG